MTECNRKNRLLGKSIRKIRMRRNMTQRELANAAGLVESALRSYELGETVASWVEFPNGWYLHSDDADAEFTQDGAKTYLQRLKSVWMESPFWDSVKAMEEKPQ